MYHSLSFVYIDGAVMFQSVVASFKPGKPVAQYTIQKYILFQTPSCVQNIYPTLPYTLIPDSLSHT